MLKTRNSFLQWLIMNLTVFSIECASFLTYADEHTNEFSGLIILGFMQFVFAFC